MRLQGSCVVHALPSGVIFHDGRADWRGRFGLLVQERLSQQEHQEEPCGYSSRAFKGIHGALTCTNNCFSTPDSALYKQRQHTSVFFWFVCHMMFVWKKTNKHMFKRVSLESKCLMRERETEKMKEKKEWGGWMGRWREGKLCVLWGQMKVEEE